MTQLVENYYQVLDKIRRCEKKYHRPSHSVTCLAVSKRFPVGSLRPLIDVGQRAFGENYLQEALPKISAITDKNIEWHYIGQIQSRKCGDIARHFQWVHTVCRQKEIDLLAQHRPQGLTPLQICLQVKLDEKHTKGGVFPEALQPLAIEVLKKPNLKLRGLMVLPPQSTDFEQQRHYFRQVVSFGERLSQELGHAFDTYSMGMTNDLEAAIAEGATMLRIGTGIFGPRP